MHPVRIKGTIRKPRRAKENREQRKPQPWWRYRCTEGTSTEYPTYNVDGRCQPLKSLSKISDFFLPVVQKPYLVFDPLSPPPPPPPPMPSLHLTLTLILTVILIITLISIWSQHSNIAMLLRLRRNGAMCLVPRKQRRLLQI